jgi:putative transcriptional regulator
MPLGPYLEGKLLIAMPGIGDPRFDRSVIFLCSHTAEGAMGLIVNKPMQDMSLSSLLEQLDITPEQETTTLPVFRGGPVETSRGFVLHSDEFAQDTTVAVAEGIALTATIDMLKALAKGEGPDQAIVALGYAGWAPGQLDRELTRNGWLTADASRSLVFETHHEAMWPAAIATMGFDVGRLSGETGHA